MVDSERGPDTPYTIDRIEMGTGWVCFRGGDDPPPPAELPSILSEAMSEWLTRNSEFRLRTALPIVQDGHTMAIHVWFD